MRAVHAARPYWFEIFTIANLLAIGIVLHRLGISIVTTLPVTLLTIVPSFVAQLAVGVLIRIAVSRQSRAAFRDGGWIIDSIRLIVFGALWTHAYCWIKLTIPLLHPRLFDAELWNADRALFFGVSPNLLFVNLFSNPAAMRAIDWSYANVFVGSIFVAGAFFLSAPDRALRIRFMNANTTMWLIGAWLYVALPSLGPAYRFPDIWLPLAAWLPQTQLLQRRLMTNYQIVLQYAQRPRPVSILLGIAAFPSLHVAFEMLVLLQIRRVWRIGKILFAVAFVLIFVGSVVTGWHYLIDALAGVLLAVACHAAFQRPLPRFLRHAAPD